jgi:hypothetical protein
MVSALYLIIGKSDFLTIAIADYVVTIGFVSQADL